MNTCIATFDEYIIKAVDFADWNNYFPEFKEMIASFEDENTQITNGICFTFGDNQKIVIEFSTDDQMFMNLIAENLSN